MGRYATAGSTSSFKDAPEGTHVARCIRIVDLGTQRGEYQGKPYARNQVMLTWELPLEMMDEDDQGNCKPYIVSAFLTNSLWDQSKMYEWLINWRGKAFTEDELAKFDLNAILGAPCIVTVVKNEKGKVKVGSVAKLTKGTECPPAYNKPSAFWIEESSQTDFESLPEGIRKIIEKSDEWKARSGPQGVPQTDDPEIPF